MKRWFAAILIFCAQSVWAQSPIAITFDKDEVGRFPSGWVSENQKDMTKVYSVQAILTDSDNRHSRAVGDYADISSSFREVSSQLPSFFGMQETFPPDRVSQEF